MSVDLNRLTAHLSPQQQDEVKKAYHRQEEHSTAAFLYCFFLGIFGAHRFYLRQWGKGFAHLIIPVIIAAVIVAGFALSWPAATIALVVIPLLVIALIWEILDLFTIDAEVYRRNLKLAEQLVAQSLLADTTVEQRGQARLESMLQSEREQAAAAAQEERVASEAAAASAAPVDDAATLPEVGGAAMEAATVSELRDGAAGMSTDQYVETTVAQISDNPAARNGEPDQADQLAAPASWSVTETVHGDDTETAGATAAGEEAIAGAGAMGLAEDERAEAVADSAEYTDTVTRVHEETPYSVTDIYEHVQTFAAAETTDTAETVAAEAAEAPYAAEVEAPPTYAEATAPTWPDYPPVEDVAGIGAVAAVAAAAAAADPAPAQPSPSAPSAPRDITDLGATYGDVKPLADVATEGGEPQRVVLPGADDVLVGMGAMGMQQSVVAEPAASPVYTPIDSPVDIASAPAGTDTPAAGDESLLMFVPEPSESEEAAPTSAPTDAEPVGAVGSSLSAAEEAGIAGMAALAAAGTYAALTGDTRTPPPPPEQPAAPQGETLAAPQGETLAELAGYGAGTSVESVEHTPPAPPAPAAEPEPAPAPAAAPAPEYHETHTDEVAHPHHSMRRIRVVRQVKVGDQVVEETTAEEFIEADADPEPVRLRLQEMLRQQAASRQQANPGNA